MAKLTVEVLVCDRCGARSDEGRTIHPWRFATKINGLSRTGHACHDCMNIIADNLPGGQVRTKRPTITEVVDLDAPGA